MPKHPIIKEYPVSPEAIQKILQDCARQNGLNVVICETYNEEIHLHINNGEIMRDKYEGGQIGAQGPHAHAHDMKFDQIWFQNQGNIDLDSLANELCTLRNEMQKSAKNPEDYIQIGAIASAEIEAKKGNGPQALSSLKKVGKWGLNIAEKIGVDVATAAIKAACGL
jgi:hypothetical protein